jgi:hypothetical protein
MTYQEWIAENVSGTGYGECAEVTENMAAAFPELKRVRGYYYCLLWGPRYHWWLVDPSGNIVDPTASQFPSTGGQYAEWGNRIEPTGKCANCGDLIYNGDTACGPECHRELVASLTPQSRHV